MKIPQPLLDSLYLVREDEARAFGDKWMGPNRFEPWMETCVALYPKRRDSDGQNTCVYMCAGPARFYVVRAEVGEDSAGNPLPPFTLSTGSGSAMRDLAIAMAAAIADGMLGVRVGA